jgi:2-polyprenyl-3-methyl-5-hydroxy-6-metoxy-1,4-benzoquinol methylase
MLRCTLSKFVRSPLRVLRNGFYKVFIGPARYAKGDDYDAERYWRDRFGRHGLSLQGAGDEGLSEEDNRRAYEAAARQLADVCRQEGVDLARACVLEIGVGTGFYTQWLAGAGVARYVGLDITDALFPSLAARHPGFRFIKQDVTQQAVEGKFDAVFMIDVIEHIVTEEKLTAAMEHVKACLAPGGVFFLTGVQQRHGKSLFYVYCWAPDDIRKRFEGYDCKGPIPYFANNLMIFRKPAQVKTAS